MQQSLVGNQGSSRCHRCHAATPMMLRLIAAATLLLALAGRGAAQEAPSSSAQRRLRVPDLGLKIGVYQPGPLDAITDVAGVRVGQVTLVEGDDVRTGVTAILPHDGNMFQDRVAAAVYVYNAFGKLVGATQVNELGEPETPILLTNTLSVWDAARALADWMLGLPSNQDVRSVNPVVGETNDGWLSDIRGRHVKAADVVRALGSARGGPVDEGSVGAGTGTIALGWKGGIGTSSRKLQPEYGGFTLGVLVQSNFGGDFTLDGVPVWRVLRALPSEPPPGVSQARLLHDRRGDRCAARLAAGRAARQAGGPGHGAGGKLRLERQRRLRHCLLDHEPLFRPTFHAGNASAASPQRRRTVPAFRGRHRSDRGGHRQFHLAGDYGPRPRRTRGAGHSHRQAA